MADTTAVAKIRAMFSAGRIDGKSVSYRQVAKDLGVSPKTVRSAVVDGTIGSKSAKSVSAVKVNSRRYPVATITKIFNRKDIAKNPDDLIRQLRDGKKGVQLRRTIKNYIPDTQGQMRMVSARFKSRINDLRDAGVSVSRRDMSAMITGDAKTWQQILSE